MYRSVEVNTSQPNLLQIRLSFSLLLHRLGEKREKEIVIFSLYLFNPLHRCGDVCTCIQLLNVFYVLYFRVFVSLTNINTQRDRKERKPNEVKQSSLP